MDRAVCLNYLLDRLSYELNMTPQCSIDGTSNSNTDYFTKLVQFVQKEVGLHVSCVDDLPTFHVDGGNKDYRNWLDTHLDWDAERMIAYHKPEVFIETALKNLSMNIIHLMMNWIYGLNRLKRMMI